MVLGWLGAAGARTTRRFAGDRLGRSARLSTRSKALMRPIIVQVVSRRSMGPMLRYERVLSPAHQMAQRSCLFG